MRQEIIVTTRGPSLVWVIGRKSTMGQVTTDKGQCRFMVAPGVYSVAVFKVRDDYLDSDGQGYIEVSPRHDEIIVTLGVLKQSDSNWYYGKEHESSGVTVSGMVQSLTEDYGKIHQTACVAARKYIEDNFKSNPQLEKLLKKEQIGFCRLSQRRDGHHGIMTTSVAGIPELHSFNVGVETIRRCFTLVKALTGFDEVLFGSVNKDCQKVVLEELACGLLASFGFKNRWNNERYDSICNPAIVLGTMQDCEDNAVAVVSAFNWIKENEGTILGQLKEDSFEYRVVKQIIEMADEMYMAAGFVDVEIANPTITNPNTISGHAFAILKLKENYILSTESNNRYVIVECTDSFYIHPSTNDAEKDKLLVKTSTGGVLCQASSGSNATINHSSKLPKDRYKSICNIFTENGTYYVVVDDEFKKSVGVSLVEFMEGKFHLVPIVPDEISKPVREINKKCIFSASLENAGILLDQLPELKDLYKKFNGVEINSEIKPRENYTVMHIYDINKKKLTDVSGIVVPFGLSPVVLVPTGVETNHVVR
jgi:hypothetical protein